MKGRKKPLVMVAEDEVIIARDIQNKLKYLGYDVSGVISTGEEAIAVAEELRPDIVLMDIVLKGEIDGINAAAVIRDRFAIPVIYLTAYADGETLERAKITEPFGYMLKPFEERELYSNIEMVLYKDKAEKRHGEMVEKLMKSLESTVTTLAFAMETRDPYTAGHQRRVAKLAVAIAEGMGLSPDDIKGIRLATLIHDIGKIKVPAEILSKPGRLTDTEFKLIMTHPQTGYEILKDIDFPWPVAMMILQHHERLDGSGYPQGLTGGEILPGSNIIGVADVVEAMSSHRPYRAALGTDGALEEISSKRGKIYQPEVVDICLRLFREEGFTFE